jgi:hypothetical protein
MAAYTADKVFGASPETQEWISEKVRRMKIPLLPDMSMAPTSDELHQATTSLIGESYRPRTTWGEYSRTFGEVLPNLVGGGGKLIPRVLKDVVLPGLASETAGQLVEGTFLEPYVRGAAEMLTPLASSGIRRTMMPNSPTPRRPSTVPGSVSDKSHFGTGPENTAPRGEQIVAPNPETLNSTSVRGSANSAERLRSPDWEKYLPPDTPERPFAADYPAGARAGKGGRLLADIEGRPLVAKWLTGRRAAGGFDEGVQRADVAPLIQGITGSSPKRVRMPPDRGGRYNIRDRSVFVSDAFAPEADTAIQLAAHELGHAIDHFADWIRFKPSQRGVGIDTHRARNELLFVYNDVNNKPLNRMRKLGHNVESWVDKAYQGTTPELVGYPKGFKAERELAAEGIRAYLFNPNYMKTVAPTAAALFRAYVNSNSRLKYVIQLNSLVGAALLGAGANAEMRADSGDRV